MKRTVLISIIVLVIILVGWSAVTTASTYVEEPGQFEQLVRLNNCAGSSDIEESLERASSSSVNSELGLGLTKKLVEMQIARSFETVSNQSVSVKFGAAPKTAQEFKILWKRNLYKGQIRNAVFGTAMGTYLAEKVLHANYEATQLPCDSPPDISEPDPPPCDPPGASIWVEDDAGRAIESLPRGSCAWLSWSICGYSSATINGQSLTIKIASDVSSDRPVGSALRICIDEASKYEFLFALPDGGNTRRVITIPVANQVTPTAIPSVAPIESPSSTAVIASPTPSATQAVGTTSTPPTYTPRPAATVEPTYTPRPPVTLQPTDTPTPVTDPLAWINDEVTILAGNVTWSPCPTPDLPLTPFPTDPKKGACARWNVYEHPGEARATLQILRCHQHGEWADNANVGQTGLEVGIHSEVAAITVRTCE